MSHCQIWFLLLAKHLLVKQSMIDRHLCARSVIGRLFIVYFATPSDTSHRGVMNVDQFQHDLSHRLRLLDVLDRITQVNFPARTWRCYAWRADLLRLQSGSRLVCIPDPDAPSCVPWSVLARNGWLSAWVLISMDSKQPIFREMLSTNGLIQYGPDTSHPVPLILEQFSVNPVDDCTKAENRKAGIRSTSLCKFGNA